MTLDEVAGHFQNVRRVGSNLSARCPAHDDGRNSLSISNGDKAIVLKCQAGCDTADVLSKIGLGFIDLYPTGNGHGTFQIAATYSYRDEGGVLLYEAVRMEPKDFRARRPDGAGGWIWKLGDTRRVLYRLPELLKTDPTETIWIVEGEKDVDRLRSLGLTATTNPGGAGKWRKEYNDHLKDRHVIILPDNDDPGRKHAQQVSHSLLSIATSIKVVELPGLADHGDVSDWIGAGGASDALRELAEKAPRWEPSRRQEEQKGEKPTIHDEVHLTDLGNAARFIGDHGDRLRYDHTRKTWLIWTGRRWAVDDRGEVRRLAEKTVKRMFQEAIGTEDEDARKRLVKHALATESEGRIQAMINVATSHEAVAVTAAAFDPDPWLLNCQNGTLNLSTGTLHSHDPGDHLIHCLPVAYDPKAECPLWKRFLSHVLGGDQELVSFVQRAVGYTLTGSTREQVFFLLYGTGSNGKSVFLEILRSLLVDLAVHADFNTFLHHDRKGKGPTNDIARLRGARLVTATEAEGEKRFAVALIKTLTGCDTVTARFLYAEDFEFRPTFKIWTAANHRPVIRDTDFATWRRIKLIPFTITVAEQDQDPDLADKLRGELPGILTWAVQGCQDWIAHRLGKAGAVTDATARYKSDMDTVAPFFEEVCDFGPLLRVKAGDLFHAYKGWAERNGGPALSQRALATYLQERPGKVEPRKIGSSRWWFGVGLAGEGGTDEDG